MRKDPTKVAANMSKEELESICVWCGKPIFTIWCICRECYKTPCEELNKKYNNEK